MGPSSSMISPLSRRTTRSISVEAVLSLSPALSLGVSPARRLRRPLHRSVIPKLSTSPSPTVVNLAPSRSSTLPIALSEILYLPRQTTCHTPHLLHHQLQQSKSDSSRRQHLPECRFNLLTLLSWSQDPSKSP